MAAGRPSKYKPEYAQQAFKLCLLGATDKQMADIFGVTVSTLNLWKLEHDEFSEALKNGKDRADAEVASRLYSRALGYSHPDVKILQYEGEPIIVPITKYYPPDTTAAIFWLKNRQKANWRDKQDHEHTGKDGGPIETVSRTAGMTEDEKIALARELRNLPPDDEDDADDPTSP